MKLTKAIEILELLDHSNNEVEVQDFRDAVKLAREALKCVANNRKFGIPNSVNPLPGETPEPATKRSLHHIKALLESPLGKEPKG